MLEQTAGHDFQILIEAVAAMPGNEASSIFWFGKSVGVDNEGKPFITGGLQMIPGSGHEQLLASVFS
jgi:hypothetical protein